LPQTLQILQIILFSIPIGALLVLGIVILAMPVVVINRRWYLLMFFPLILANLIAMLESNLADVLSIAGNWRLWLVMVGDALLLGIGIFLFRGFQVIGLDDSEVMAGLREFYLQKHFDVQCSTGEKQIPWGEKRKAMIISVKDQELEEDLWVEEKPGEVILRADSARGLALIRQALPELRQIEKPNLIKTHLLGILFIVLAVVIAVLGWIFFFEPRLILIEV